MNRFHRFLRPSTLALALAMALPVFAADKQRIDKEADIPRFTYVVSEPLEKIVRDKILFEKVTRPVRADIESVLAKYEIGDKAAHRSMLSSLLSLDFLEGKYDAVLAGVEQLRALEEKPANKLLAGLRLRAMVAAVKQTGGINTPAYFEAAGSYIRKDLEALPFDVIANDVKGYKASAELIGEGRILGWIRDEMQVTVNKSGALSSDVAPGVINARYALETALPLKQTLITTYSAYLDQHKVEKTDIWAARNVTLPDRGNYKPVNVAVWDSGVDTKLFPKQLLKDAKGRPALIAHDLQARPTQGELFPIPAAVKPKLPEMLARTKGFSDLQSNIDSPEATDVKQFFSGLKPDEFKYTMEMLGLSGNYEHGTHVAGITLEGNPWARLAVARISFGFTLMPDPCPSKALAVRGAKSYQANVDFFKRNKVRVVNMSWGGSVKSVEEELEKCGIGKTTEER